MNLEFKVWDKYEQQMYEVCSIYFPLGTQGGKDIGIISKEDADLSEWRSVDEVDLLQWTGLFDDKGIKIFHNDIVEVTEGVRKHFSQVRMSYMGIWIDSHPVIKDITGKTYDDLINYCDYGIGRGINQTCVVVGNIYKNHEMLHKNKLIGGNKQ